MPRRLDPETVRIRLTAKEKRAKAAALRVQARTWQQIADECGYGNPGTAYKAVQQHFKEYPSPDVEELRRVENEKLDKLEQAALGILARQHVVISQGRIVGRYTGRIMRDETGEFMYREKDGKILPVYEIEELEDDGPLMQAITTVLRIMDRRAKMNGTDVPVVKEETDDGSVDQEIAALVEEIVATGDMVIPQGHDG